MPAMNPIARNASSITWFAVALLAGSTIWMWLPALQTPFWGDDYVFLSAAQATNASGLPWWSDFWPSSPPRFWRPLSQEGYWRVVEAWLGGNAFHAHALNLVLHALASAAVALLGFTTARACRWAGAAGIGALAGVMYGALGMHLLPVHWVAAANNSMLTLFTALALSAWVAASGMERTGRVLLLASVPLLLAAALLSKEPAALTPILMVVLWVFLGRGRPGRGEILAWLACTAVIAVWLLLRARFTANTDAAYEFTMGSNLVRNIASFAAWMLNVPREALRMALTGETVRGAAWIAATAVPMLAAWTIAARGGWAMLTPRQWLAVPVFCILAYGPYFFFAWNSYEYYAAIAAILPVIVMARCVAGHRRAVVVVILLALSSWISVAGTRKLDHPGLIGRAHWAEDVLLQLERQRMSGPLWVRVEDEQRFYALGQAGLAWRLGIDHDAIHVVDACPIEATRCLGLKADGSWYWQPSTADQ